MQGQYRKLGISIGVTSCVAVLGLGILAWTVPLAQSQKDALKAEEPRRPKINRTSKTEALQVVSASAINRFAKVSLKNVSNKNINGIQLAINGGIYQIEFLDATAPESQKIAPGATYEEMFRFDGEEPVEVAILAVTFDDKTSDGRASLANEIFETRKGVKKQLLRFKPFLADALKSFDADSSIIFDRLTKAANELTEGDSEDSGGMKMGQIQAKHRIIQEINQVKEKQLSRPGLMTIRESLSEIETRHARRIHILE